MLTFLIPKIIEALFFNSQNLIFVAIEKQAVNFEKLTTARQR